MNEKKYQSKEFAQIFGIKYSNLRFLERQGLLNVERDENGYRLYQEKDATDLSTFIAASSLGFTVAEAIEMVRTLPAKEVLERLQNQINKVQKEKLLLDSAEKKARQLYFAYMHYQEELTRVHRVAVPDYYCIPVTHLTQWEAMDVQNTIQGRLNDLIAVVYQGFYVDASGSIELCYFFDRDYVDQLPEKALFQNVQIVSLGACAAVLCETEVEDAEQVHIPPKHVRDIMNENHLQQRAGEMAGIYLMFNVDGCAPNACYWLVPIQ